MNSCEASAYVRSDVGCEPCLFEQVQQRTGMTAQQWLVDGGDPAHEQIDAVADKTEVYAPVPESKTKKDKKAKGKGEAGEESGKTDKASQSQQARASAARPDKHQPNPGDSAAVAQWRQRMASPEAKEIYKLRAATAECVNAQARNRGLQRLPARGLGKVKCVALLFVLAHNLMRAVALMPQWFTAGQTPSAVTAVAG